jgi:hypothetical protein
MTEKLAHIIVSDVTENEDGSATYSFQVPDEDVKQLTEIGIEFVLYCAAAKMDIQDALKLILSAGKLEE